MRAHIRALDRFAIPARLDRPAHTTHPARLAACAAAQTLMLALALALAVGVFRPAFADEPKDDTKKAVVIGKWVPNLEAGLTLTQGSYSDNWAGGDKGSIVWALIANTSVENQFDPKANWRNTFKLAFGQTHQQKADSSGSRFWDKPEKSTDLIDFESLLRLTLGGWVDPFASIAFQSQFQDASDPAGRLLTLNPILVKESAGIAREFAKSEDRTLLTRLGFTFRQNSRRSFIDPAPLERTETERTNDGGFEWVTESKRPILQKRVTWTSKLTVYQPVFYSGKDDLDNLSDAYLEAHGIDTDVASLSTGVTPDLENILSAHITKLISVELYARWLYDAYDNSVKPLPAPGGGAITNPQAVRLAVRKAGQFKETMAIGVTYRFL